jgi:hypothetical protein
MSPDELSDESAPAKQHWTIDKRIPIALIVAIVANFVGVVFWVATLNSAVVNQGERITHLEADRSAAATTLQALQITVARIDERIAYIIDALHNKK